MENKIFEDKEAIIKTSRKLEKEGFDIWENDPYYQGIGFKVISQDIWGEVGMIANFSTPNLFYVRIYQRDGNIFDSFKDKEVKNIKTENLEEVYNFIKSIF